MSLVVGVLTMPRNAEGVGEEATKTSFHLHDSGFKSG